MCFGQQEVSYVTGLAADRYSKFTGRPAEDLEVRATALSVFVEAGLPLLPSPCPLPVEEGQYLYGDSDRQAIENARINRAYKYPRTAPAMPKATSSPMHWRQASSDLQRLSHSSYT